MRQDGRPPERHISHPHAPFAACVEEVRLARASRVAGVPAQDVRRARICIGRAIRPQNAPSAVDARSHWPRPGRSTRESALPASGDADEPHDVVAHGMGTFGAANRSGAMHAPPRRFPPFVVQGSREFVSWQGKRKEMLGAPSTALIPRQCRRTRSKVAVAADRYRSLRVTIQRPSWYSTIYVSLYVADGVRCTRRRVARSEVSAYHVSCVRTTA